MVREARKTITCPVCAREFQYRASSRTCSQVCADARLASLAARECARCGSTFAARHVRQTYCSRACQQTGRGKRLNDRSNRLRTCFTCKETFTGTQSNCGICLRERKYGLPRGGWQKLFDAQGGTCAFSSCDQVAEVVDHDHETGQVRGLLCDFHNQALGRFGDSVAGLLEALTYLLQAEGSFEMEELSNGH